MGCSPSTPEVAPEPLENESGETTMDLNTSGKAGYRPSIISLQIPNEMTDDLSSENMSDRSGDDPREPSEYLYGTDVTLDWLLQKIGDSLGKTLDEEPQWITERLNRPSWDVDYATSSVVRVTFGWDDESLPKSVVLKTPVAKDQREDEEAKYHYLMFKRECNVYEWTSKFPKLPAPGIIHIKKHSKEGSGVVVMEDVSEKGVDQDPVKGLTVEVVKDLLKHLAFLHATSLKHPTWTTLVADLPPSYYAHITANYNSTMDFFERHDVEHSRFVETGKYFSDEYLFSTATETCDQLGIPRVLIHGEPYAPNIFTKAEKNHQVVSSIIDWTESHSGCFAEDIAKSICWNLSAKDRIENTEALLESYYESLSSQYEKECPITLETVQKAYEIFVPFAMVSLCEKVMSMKNKTECEPLIDRAKSLIQQMYTLAKVEAAKESLLDVKDDVITNCIADRLPMLLAMEKIHCRSTANAIGNGKEALPIDCQCYWQWKRGIANRLPMIDNMPMPNSNVGPKSSSSWVDEFVQVSSRTL